MSNHERITKLERRVARLERLLEAHMHAANGRTIVIEGEWPNRQGVALHKVLTKPLDKEGAAA